MKNLFSSQQHSVPQVVISMLLLLTTTSRLCLGFVPARTAALRRTAAALSTSTIHGSGSGNTNSITSDNSNYKYSYCSNSNFNSNFNTRNNKHGTRLYSSTNSNSNSNNNSNKNTNFVEDPTKAKLSSLTNLQKKYQLTTPVEDRLPLVDKQRLVCIGDVHGDIKALKEFLTIAQVYRNDRWIGGNTILVQCGDVLDRGSTELACFKLLSDLSQQAQEDGGRVIVLWGNHEALNAAGLFHYTTGDSEYEVAVGSPLDTSLKTNRWRLQFAGNQPARWAAFEPGGLLANTLLGNMKVAVQVGKTVCVHAGLKKEHLDKWGGLEGMNRLAQEYIVEGELGMIMLRWMPLFFV